MRIFNIKSIAFALAIGTVASLSFTGNAVAETKVKVGVLLPYSGTYAVMGNSITDGFRFALEQEGRSGEFTIIREDTEVKPPIALAKTRKLILQDKVDVIVGIVSSGVLGALRDFVDNAKVPLIVANAGNIHATGKSCSPYIVRVSFSNGQINRPMGTWLKKQGINSVYTLAPDYAAGHQMIESFAETYQAAGGKIIGSEYTPFGQTKDFGAYLTKAASSGADAIYVFYAGGEAINFVKQYGSYAIKTPLYGSGFLTSSLYVEAQGDAAVGVKTSLHYVPTLDSAENKKFVAAYQKKYNRSPSEYDVQGYDAAQLLMRAVSAGGSDKKAIAKNLTKVKYTGPRGPLSIDKKTNNIVQNIYVYETVKENGKLTQKMIDTVKNVRDAPNGCQL